MEKIQEYKMKNNKLEEHNNIYYQNEQQMSEQLNAMKIEQKKLETMVEDYYEKNQTLNAEKNLSLIHI